MTNPLLIAKTEAAQDSRDCVILPRMANRHGLIAGATGTGKTVTLQAMVERFSQIGVPVFVADIKGDLAGMCLAGQPASKAGDRVKQLALKDFKFEPCSVTFWDVFGEQGHPLRTTISEMGPLLLARLLNLNDTQTGVLNIAFKIADDQGLLLLDFKDLRALIQYIGDKAKEFRTQYGNISPASVGAIQRNLLSLEQQGGDRFFGEPALDLMDFLQTDAKGYGMVNVLAANKLMLSPKLYATFLLWLLSELFEQLPEVGDLEKPKLLFFFDEAHLLFNDAPDALLEKVEQVVRLIRSKGVGVYFCTQNPMDVPINVLGQLGNRVQHALRAFTPLDQKAVKTAAQTFRSNPNLDVEAAIAELAVGEALVSFLDEQGAPSVVERALIIPPGSQIGAIAPEQRQQILQNSVLFGHYEAVSDRESAYEMLQQKTTVAAQQAATAVAQAETAKQAEVARKQAEQAATAQATAQAKEAARQQAALQKQAEREAVEQAKAAERAAREQEQMLLSLAEGAAQMFGGTAGKKIARGVLGGIMGYGTNRRRR
jgi:uncharacterized protein